MKYLSVFAALVLSVFLLFGCTTSASDTTYVALDINPSVELVLEKGVVVAVNPLNEDGEILLAELDLIGKTIEEASNEIIDLAIELGYIDVDSEDNVISVTVIGPVERDEIKMKERIRNHINNAFVLRGVYGYAYQNEVSAELIAEAETLGVSVGKLRLVKLAQEMDPELTLEVGLEMPVKDLMAIIRSQVQGMKEIANQIREDFHDARELLINEYRPQIQALEVEIADLQEQIALETDETTLEELNELLVTKEAELEALKEAFHTAMIALHEEFKTESEQFRSQVQAQHEALKEQHRARIEQFRGQASQNGQQIRDRIREYQSEHDGE